MNNSKLVYFTDDEEDYAKLMCKMLENEGFQVEYFTKSKDCFKAVKEIRPDVVITDYLIPDESGKWLKTQIQNYDASIPVIMLTALSEVAEKEDLCFIKPVDKHDLFEYIKRS